jgi:transcriptional regulator GlxA family with amidase domain
MTQRREFLAGAAALGGTLATRGWAASGGAVGPLKAPARGNLNVAFAVSNGATVIDFLGPWEVFQDVMIAERGPDHMEDQMPFRLYTVADAPAPVRVSGGLQIVPDFTVENAPPPRVVVVPAMRASAPMLEWLRKTSQTADIVMSVCTGAFTLGKAGLLADAATTHHNFFDAFEKEFPAVKLERGRRFVERERLATAGGLTSGIDLALRVVDRYFGRKVALTTAEYMEYESRSWVV